MKLSINIVTTEDTSPLYFQFATTSTT